MNLDPQRIAAALGAEIVAEGGPGSPARATIDSGATGEGDLFFGLRGERVDGGEFAPAAIEAGAWGVVVGPAARSQLFPDSGKSALSPAGAGSSRVEDPLAALQALALAWRRALGARVRRGHRLGRQDLGQGHRPGAAARAGSTPTARTSTPRSGCR